MSIAKQLIRKEIKLGMLATRNKILDMESKRDLALKIIKINNEIANDELVVVPFLL